MLTNASAPAQNTAVLWGAFDQGFAIPTSARTMVKSAAGQAFIGFTQATDTWHNAGFLADTLLRGSRGPSGPMVSFRHTFGGGAVDYGYSLVQTPDKGFIIAGQTRSFVPMQEGYLVKTAQNGALQWQHNFHRVTFPTGLQGITHTIDDGYAAAGWSEYYQSTGITAFFLAKLNANGDTMWTRTYGPPVSQAEGANAIVQTNDGGYVLAGIGSQIPSIGGPLIYVIKTNATGDTMWTRKYSGNSATSVGLTSDGGYIIAGWAQAPVIIALRLIKLDSTGNTVWNRTIGETNFFSYSGSAQQTIDGGYILSGSYAVGVGGALQAYLVKTNDSGNVVWTRKYFSPGYNGANSVSQTYDGGYIMTGVTGPNSNVQDAFLLKTAINGDSLWCKVFGGTGSDRGWSVIQTEDGGYAFSGETSSSGAGLSDMWLVKGDDNGNVTSVEAPIPPGVPASFTLDQNYPNPFNPSTTIAYTLKGAVHVRLAIFNILGQEVMTLVNEVQNPGYHEKVFDAGSVATGVYFYQLKAGEFVEVKKMLLLK
jgi:hypothetical protein